MATRFTPPRFTPKGAEEKTTITLDFGPDIGANKTIVDVKWRSNPVGLQFGDVTGIDGTEVSVQLLGGVAGQEYRVLCEVMASGDTDTYQAASGDFLGIPIYILPETFAVSPQSDYSYGNI